MLPPSRSSTTRPTAQQRGKFFQQTSRIPSVKLRQHTLEMFIPKDFAQSTSTKGAEKRKCKRQISNNEPIDNMAAATQSDLLDILLALGHADEKIEPAHKQPKTIEDKNSQEYFELKLKANLNHVCDIAQLVDTYETEGENAKPLGTSFMFAGFRPVCANPANRYINKPSYACCIGLTLYIIDIYIYVYIHEYIYIYTHIYTQILYIQYISYSL